MSEENKAIARRFVDVFRTGDVSVLDELLSSDFVDHNPFPDQAPGPEGMKELISMMKGVFPDMVVSTEDMGAEGDKVVTRWTGSGTHRHRNRPYRGWQDRRALGAVRLDGDDAAARSDPQRIG